MSFTNVQRPRTLSPRGFARLSSTLNASNARYSAIAASVRVSTTRTYHARKRAQRLELGIDIERAVNCPMEKVALVPLPIIDTTPEPAITIAAPSVPVQRGRSTVPRCPAAKPGVLIDANANTRVLFSTISLAPGHTAPAPAPAPAASNNGVLYGMLPWKVYAHASAYANPCYLVPLRAPPEPPVIPPLDLDDDDEFESMELVYPASSDPTLASCSSDASSSSSDAVSRAGSVTSSRSSTASSSGPATPTDDIEMAPASGVSESAKGKRKMCAAIDLDSSSIVDKRPKFERKAWVRSPRKLC